MHSVTDARLTRVGRLPATVLAACALACATAAALPGKPAHASASSAGQAGLLAYEAVQEDGSQAIFAKDLASGAVGALTSGPQIDSDPAFSPDGLRLAFASDRDGDEEIYVASWDGSGPTQLTVNDTYDGEPAFSPTGDAIAYRSGEDAAADIYVRSLADGSTRLLAGDAGSDKSPAWSPRGDLIAFVSDRSGQDDVYTATLDGKLVKRLTDSASADIDPAWSPDGKKIAFASNRSGQLDLYTMTATGKNQQNQTESEATEQEPAWSADGARIAFSGSSGEGETDIYSLAADGDLAVDQLVERPGQEASPAFQSLDYSRPRSRIVSPRLGRRAKKRAGRSRARRLSVKLRAISGRVEKEGASPVASVEVAVRITVQGRCYELQPSKRASAAYTRCGKDPAFFAAKGTSRFSLRIPNKHRRAIAQLYKRAARTSKKAARYGTRCEVLTRAVDQAGNVETRFERGRNRVRLRCR